MSRMFQISSKERKSQGNGWKHSLRIRTNDKVREELMNIRVITTG